MVPWGWRRLLRPVRFSPAGPRGPGKRVRFSSAFLTLFIGFSLAWGLIFLLEARVQPVIAAAARDQVRNTALAAVEEAVSACLAGGGAGDSRLVEIQRDSSGAVLSVTTDAAAMNRLRLRLVEDILTALEGIDISQVSVPLGVLLDSDLLWGRGPALSARALTVGTVSAEFDTQFTSAGVNQTIHRVWLELSLPMTVLLPGGAVEVPLETRLCIAETVIVGQVPGTYLQMEPAGG